MKQLELVIDERFQLTRRVGSGSFGVVYEGLDLNTKQEVAIKLEDASSDTSLLYSEFELYQSLKRGIGIPEVYWHGIECDYNVMAMELLGPSLEDLFNYCNRRFSMKTILMLADQLLPRLEHIHSQDIIHRDIKPQHFLMGSGRRGNHIYITDFGLAWSSFASTARMSRGLMGTALFASVKGHTGEEQNEFDDLESMGYMLLYLLRGCLPWSGVRRSDRYRTDDAILQVKSNTSVSDLCQDLPTAFSAYFTYLREHRGKTRADHARLRRGFRTLFLREGYKYDNVFDWTIRKYSEEATND